MTAPMLLTGHLVQISSTESNFILKVIQFLFPKPNRQRSNETMMGSPSSLLHNQPHEPMHISSYHKSITFRMQDIFSLHAIGKATLLKNEQDTLHLNCTEFLNGAREESFTCTYQGDYDLESRNSMCMLFKKKSLKKIPTISRFYGAHTLSL